LGEIMKISVRKLSEVAVWPEDIIGLLGRCSPAWWVELLELPEEDNFEMAEGDNFEMAEGDNFEMAEGDNFPAREHCPARNIAGSPPLLT
jgi:hypothetical protein